jgi:hypothetical protein
LIVFERQATANPSVYVGLDVASAQHADRETRDAMVRLYGSLCQQFQSHHWSLWVSMGDRGVVRLSPAQRLAFLDHLATWDFSDHSQVHSKVGIQTGMDGLQNDRPNDLGIGAQRPGARRAVADRTLWVTCGATAGARSIHEDVLREVGGSTVLAIFRVVPGFTNPIQSNSVPWQGELANQDQTIAVAGETLRAGGTYSVTCMVRWATGEREIDRDEWDEQLQNVWRSYCAGTLVGGTSVRGTPVGGTLGLGSSMRNDMQAEVLEGVS